MDEASPRFRQDLVAAATEAEGVPCVDVSDPGTGTSFRFYDFEYQLALQLNGQPLRAVTAWASEAYGVDLTAEGVGEFAGRLAELGFLEPAASARRPRSCSCCRARRSHAVAGGRHAAARSGRACRRLAGERRGGVDDDRGGADRDVHPRPRDVRFARRADARRARPAAGGGGARRREERQAVRYPHRGEQGPDARSSDSGRPRCRPEIHAPRARAFSARGTAARGPGRREARLQLGDGARRQLAGRASGRADSAADAERHGGGGAADAAAGPAAAGSARAAAARVARRRATRVRIRFRRAVANGGNRPRRTASR